MVHHMLAALGLGLMYLLTAGADESLGKIVGGSQVNIKESPYFVVVHNSGQICGGSILSADWILTAAHCMVDPPNENAFEVLVGANEIEKPELKIKISAIHTHPKFDSYTLDYDYALLHLEKSLKFSSKIQPIELANEKDTLELGTSCKTFGFGLTSTEQPSEFLKMVELPVVEKDYCKWNPEFTSRMFCAGRLEGGSDACQGDSGGPFVCHGHLYGVVSAGKSCGKKDIAGIYSSIPNQRDWIKKISGL